jgi:hypothetical protein
MAGRKNRCERKEIGEKKIRRTELTLRNNAREAERRGRVEAQRLVDARVEVR